MGMYLKSLDIMAHSERLERPTLRFEELSLGQADTYPPKSKYPLTLDPSRLSARLAILLLFALTQINSCSCSLDVPFQDFSYPQVYARILHTGLSTGIVDGNNHNHIGDSCQSFSGEKTQVGLREEAPHFEVVRSETGPDAAALYLATLTRNGISVSEPIPHHIFEDDFPDDKLAIYWLRVRKRLSTDLAAKEQQHLRA